MNQKNKDIYTKICELVIDPEFNEGQIAFFEKNRHQFNDDEENKHHYKEIHEEYIKMLDLAIEVQIKQTYTDEDMDEFFKDFMENFKMYLDINEDAYNVMSASINFS